MAKKQKYHNGHSNPAKYNKGLKIWETIPYIPSSGENSPRAFDQLLAGKIGPGSHYFFFASLLTYKGPNSSALARVFSIGNELFNINDYKQDYNETMQSILQLIHGFRTFEANNEYQVFQEKLAPLINSSPELYEEFKDTFANGKIDYIHFMALLKILNQNIDAVKHELSDLEIHMKKWNITYNKAFSAAKTIAIKEKTYSGDDELFNLQHRAEITENTRKLLSNKISDAEKILASAITTLRKVQHSDTDPDIKKIKSLVKEMINSGQTKLQGTEVKSAIGATKKEEILFALYQKLQQWAKGYDISVSKLLEELKDGALALELGGESQAYNKRKDKAFNATEQYKQLAQYLQTLLENDAIALEQLKEIEAITNRGKKITTRKSSRGGAEQQYAGLIRRRRLLILETLQKLPGVNKNALKDLEYLEGEKKIINDITGEEERFDIRKKQHFKQYIKLINNITGRHLQNGEVRLPNIINMLEDIVKTSEAKTRQDIITITSETGGVLDLEHILKIAAKRIGQKNFREDSFLVGYANYQSNNDDTTLTNSIEACNSYSEALKNASETLVKLRSSAIYDDIKKQNKQAGRKEQSYDVETTLQASKAVDLATAQQLADDLNIDDLNKVANDLKNIFVIEKSDKFSTTFNTQEFGFSGGSLGGDLNKQLDNLTQMMILGNITPFEKDFLINAIMNAGPGMLGYGQKDKIETYLSSIASVCMFTSGAQSLQDYTQTLMKDVVQNLSTTKIHIFQLGTVYVPLSYILYLMEQGLEKCFTLLSNEFALSNKAGNKVTIFNPVNEASDKITRVYTPAHGPSFEIGDWDATAAAGLPKISLNMAILGSFLDVIEDINKILNNII